MTERNERHFNPDAGTQFQGIIRNIQGADLEMLRPILETWIKDRNTGQPLPQEIENVLDLMEKSLIGENNYKYIVAVETEKPIGVIGLRPVSEAMKQYAQTPKAAELINAYVNPNFRKGRGVGKKLLEGLEELARQQNYKEILLNSGPRYRDTAWGFYEKIYGEPVAVMKNFYGENGDAPVWRKSLL